MSDAALAGKAKGGVWAPYQIWVLALLLLVNTFNFLDRAILGILSQPIKLALNLTDTELGLLSGPAFALVYACTAVPVSRWAEHGKRTTILSLAVAFWGSMTALCGLAAGYWQLALARVGVGVGESACAPTTHTLLSDYFPPRQRGIAMAIMMTSIPLGGAFGALVGGVVAHGWGWRAAFVVAGIPGLALALLTRFALREPVRGGLDGGVHAAPGKFWAAMPALFRTPGYLHLALGQLLVGAGVYGSNVFMPSYVLRTFHLSLAKVGGLTAVAVGVAGVSGVLLGGYLADRLSRSSGRSYLLVPAVGCAANALLIACALMQPTWQMAYLFIAAAGVCNALKDGPTNAAVQNMVPSHMRATAAAVSLWCVNGVGFSLGPTVVGAVSDRIARQSFAGGAFDTLCRGAGQSHAADVVHACALASSDGLRTGLFVVCGFLVWGAVHFWLSSRKVDLGLGATASEA